jgi:hypothetical protein
MTSSHRITRPLALLLTLGLLVLLFLPLATRPSRAEQAGPLISSLNGVQEGQSLSGQVAIEALVGGEQIDEVDFELAGPQAASHEEHNAPYFFMGDNGRQPKGWDTTRFPDGDYTLTVTAKDKARRHHTFAVHFRIANNTQPQPDDGTQPEPDDSPVINGWNGVQQGQTLSGQAVIELLVSGDQIAVVTFKLQGPRSSASVDRRAPYFFKGDKNGVPKGWNTAKYPDGDYALTATVIDKAGRQVAQTVHFHVANGGQAQPTPTATAVPPTATVVPPTTTVVPPTATVVPPTTTVVPPTATLLPPTPTTPPSSGTPKLLFGIGPEANSALETRLVQEAPARMLTSWYNSPDDLNWMRYWENGLVPESYADGYALHLIVFTDDDETRMTTKYGTACGRSYPLSDRFPGDMQRLAEIFGGAGNGPPLYVTLFTEFQTYACTDNAWKPNAETTAYYQALKDRYREALAAFHQHAPNAKVSLGWGGWQARFDNPSEGGGRSMFQYFADVMRESDFQSFQAMQSDSNVGDVRTMVNTLNDYGPVMLAHYKPNNGSQSTFDADVRAMLTDAYLTEMTGAGLFAWSFMDNKNLSGSESTYQFVKGAVQRYGRAP